MFYQMQTQRHRIPQIRAIVICCLYSIPVIHLASICKKLQASSGCFWCQSFGDVSPYIIFSSDLVVEWPSFGK